MLSYYHFNKNINKKLIYHLNSLYGIGLYSNKLICKTLGYDYTTTRINQLNIDDWEKISSIIRVKYKFLIDNEIKKNISDSIQKQKNIKSYKGIRHLYNLPVNGRKTRKNAKTKTKF